MSKPARRAVSGRDAIIDKFVASRITKPVVYLPTDRYRTMSTRYALCSARKSSGCTARKWNITLLSERWLVKDFWEVFHQSSVLNLPLSNYSTSTERNLNSYTKLDEITAIFRTLKPLQGQETFAAILLESRARAAYILYGKYISKRDMN